MPLYTCVHMFMCFVFYVCKMLNSNSMNIPRPSGAIPGERYSRMHTLSSTATVLLSLYHRHSLAQDAQVKFANKAAIRDDGLAKLRRYSSLYLSLCVAGRVSSRSQRQHTIAATITFTDDFGHSGQSGSQFAADRRGTRTHVRLQRTRFSCAPVSRFFCSAYACVHVCERSTNSEYNSACVYR